MKNGKRVAIGARPPANPHADAWVRQGEGADIGKADLYTARLTLDVTPALRGLHTGGCVLPRALGVQRLRYDTLAANGAAGVHAARCGATHRGHPAGRAPASVRRR